MREETKQTYHIQEGEWTALREGIKACAGPDCTALKMVAELRDGLVGRDGQKFPALKFESDVDRPDIAARI